MELIFTSKSSSLIMKKTVKPYLGYRSLGCSYSCLNQQSKKSIAIFHEQPTTKFFPLIRRMAEQVTKNCAVFSHSPSTCVIWISAIVFSSKLIDSCDTNVHNLVNQFIINLTISCFSLYILRVTIFSHNFFFRG